MDTPLPDFGYLFLNSRDDLCFTIGTENGANGHMTWYMVYSNVVKEKPTWTSGFVSTAVAIARPSFGRRVPEVAKLREALASQILDRFDCKVRPSGTM